MSLVGELVVALLLPQLAGLLCHGWRARPPSTRVVLGIAAPPGLYLLGTQLYFAGLQSEMLVLPGRRTCGAFGAMVLVVLCVGTLAHGFGAALTQMGVRAALRSTADGTGPPGR